MMRDNPFSDQGDERIVAATPLAFLILRDSSESRIMINGRSGRPPAMERECASCDTP